MPDQQIFCSVPWTNTHIYWDGSFGLCCSEREQPHTDPIKYNIKNMTVGQWYNSVPMQAKRQAIHGAESINGCRDCYKEEAHGHESRRIRENFKTVIFTEQAFDRSYQQSPMRDAFATVTDRQPVDWHIDLGNECNLACKMCYPRASSKISSIYQKWQLIDATANRNWTADDQAWESFKTSILETKHLNRLHFMGGEPMLSKRFIELLDFLIAQGRTNISVSFVSNGTMVYNEIVARLKQFRSCDIEISIESIKDNNHYIRQGSLTADVKRTILELAQHQSDTFNIVLRTVPQLLSINNYDELIRWALQHKLAIQSIPLTEPDYLQISVLPLEIRTRLMSKYTELLAQLNELVPNRIGLTTGRNTANIESMLARHTETVINMLSAPEPDNAADLRQQLTQWLTRWDREFGLDARQFYPEYTEFLTQYGYQV
jgi:sulfatase maturation enzyme AslB (radical SAM superfamily)